MLKVLGTSGFKIRSKSYREKVDILKALFGLGFTWSNGEVELPEFDHAGYVFCVNSANDGFIYKCSDLLAFKMHKGEQTNYRALLGLLEGESAVKLNNGNYATHKAKGKENHYLITSEKSYYWHTVNKKWTSTGYGADGLIARKLIPLDSNLQFETFDGGTIEEHKPKTFFEGTW